MLTAAFSFQDMRNTRRIDGETTQLFGFRTKAKQKITFFRSKLRRKNNRAQARVFDSFLTDPKNNNTILSSFATIGENAVDSTEAEANSINLVDPVKDEIKRSVESALKRNAVAEKELAIPRKDTAFVQLPPLDPSIQLTSAEEEFRDKIAYFERFSELDVALLRSRRLRVVLEGMAASPLEPAVYKAFEILYQDLYPLRVAGRLIFRRLRHVMNMCVQARADELDLLQNTTTSEDHVSLPTLEAAQFAFFELIEIASDKTRVDDGGINNDQEHDLLLPTTHLLQSMWILEDLLGREDEQELTALFDPKNLGTIDFPQFVAGLQRYCEKRQEIALEDVLKNGTHQILVVAKEDYPRVLDPTRQSYSDRFDAMLDSVRGWKTLSAKGQGRRWEVLRGCWVGAENEAVRDALRIMYVDHPTMRVAGNTIFALVSALIPK